MDLAMRFYQENIASTKDGKILVVWKIVLVSRVQDLKNDIVCGCEDAYPYIVVIWLSIRALLIVIGCTMGFLCS